MFEIFSQRSCGMTIFHCEKLLSRTSKDEISSFIATFRSDVDDRICIGDDVEIMFDNYDTVPFLYKRIEDVEKFLNIREVETSCRLIEDIECLPCRSFGEIESELDTLCLSSRKCRC